MIRIDSIWLATEPMDMRAGTETALARVPTQRASEINKLLPHRWAPV
ncbi:Uncharacterized protein ALO36_00553 [Pseudomonas syringae pv. tomato]|nr:Uncharacterized protein AC502_4814 [Pseudomonas syringae pv. maculicola]KPY96073.1 Uncharacterized protein ALO36_00553 [Pseudomonas syringae pv. tomato]